MSCIITLGCSCLVLHPLAAGPGLFGHPEGGEKGQLFVHDRFEILGA